MEFKKGDKVKLPFDETGTFVKKLNIVWGFDHIVRIRKSNGFNKTNKHVEFKKEQLELEKNTEYSIVIGNLTTNKPYNLLVNRNGVKIDRIITKDEYKLIKDILTATS